jgi:hypothetical protein
MELLINMISPKKIPVGLRNNDIIIGIIKNIKNN